MATNNFYHTIGMLIASAVCALLPHAAPRRLHRSCSASASRCSLVTVYIVTILPDYLVRFFLWLLTHSLYRIRIDGEENVPFNGPALLRREPRVASWTAS